MDSIINANKCALQNLPTNASSLNCVPVDISAIIHANLQAVSRGNGMHGRTYNENIVDRPCNIIDCYENQLASGKLIIVHIPL